MLNPIPFVIGALVLTACAKAAKSVKAASPLASLAGSEWGPERASNPATSERFVAFKTGGEIIGHGGCNRFFGTYAQDGDTLTIGPLASTKMACPDLKAESEFLNNLQAARTITATHKTLIIYNADGRSVLSLQRRDWD